MTKRLIANFLLGVAGTLVAFGGVTIAVVLDSLWLGLGLAIVGFVAVLAAYVWSMELD